MTDTKPDERYVIDITGDVPGMVAAGKYVYQQQVNVADGGLVYVLEEGTVPFRKVESPVMLLPRADPPLIDRDAEMTEVLGAIRPGGTVWVSGPSGIGKSILLTHLAHRQMPAGLDSGVVHLRVKGQPLEDVVFELFYAFHDSLLPTAWVPPPPQARRELGALRAAILVDDVDGGGYEVDDLLDTAVGSAFVLSGTEPLTLSPSNVALDGLEIDHAVTLFNRTFGKPHPDVTGVRDLCEVLDGHPQCVVFAAHLVQTQDLSPANLATDLAGDRPCHRLAKKLLDTLPKQQKHVARFLTAIGGAPASVGQVTTAAQTEGANSLLVDLSRAHVAVTNSPSYRMNPYLLAAAEELWDIDDGRRQLVQWLLDELKPDEEKDDSADDWVSVALRLIDWAERAQDYSTIVELGQAIDAPLNASGRWGEWQRMLETVERAAGSYGDGLAARGWALHQLGTKAICFEDRARAEALLGEALAIRQEIGSTSAINTTQHNLEVLRLPPAGTSGGGKPDPPVPGPSPLIKTVGTLVIGALVGVAAFFGIRALMSGEGELSSDPETVEFQEIVEGSAATRQVFFANQGDAALEVERLSIEGSDAFRVESDCATLERDETCSADIVFEPEEPESFEAVLVVESSDDPGLTRIPLFARALAKGRLEASSLLLEFGRVDAGSIADLPIEFFNDGEVPLALDPLRLEAGTSFAIVESDCGVDLEGGGACSALVRFAPSLEDEYQDLLLAVPLGGAEAVAVDLKGSGIGEAEITASPSALDLGEFPVDVGEEIETVITNRGTADASLTVDLDGGGRFEVVDHSCDGELRAGKECVVRVRFLPMTIEDALRDFQTVNTTRLVEFPVVAAEMRFSEVLTIQSEGGQRLEIPVTGLAVIPWPDLVNRIDAVDALGYDENDFPFFRVGVTVANAGRVPSESGLIGVVVFIGDESEGNLFPLRDDIGEFAVIDVVEPGGVQEVSGVIAIPDPYLIAGTKLRFATVVDSCFEESVVEPFCQIRELNELNNISETFETSVPPIYVPIYPLPSFPVDSFIFVPFPRTTESFE